MSYFICGFKGDTAVCNAFEKVFVEVVPDHIRNDIAWMESKPSYLAMYGNKKVIRNVVIRDDRHGSWLAVIGTPLVRLESEQQEQAFLAEVLTSPADALRKKIDGNFAAFAYDAPRNRLIAATDLNSTTPIFYTMTPNGVLFSSHELPLARFVNAEIDPFGFAQLMHLGVTWNSHTRFRNIHKMLPCQICVIGDDMKLRTERYWEPLHERMWSGAFEDHIQKWISMLKEAVWKFYECSDHKPAIADFTAGEDSRLIVALCHALRIPFRAHVTGLPDDSDVIVAKQAAEKAGFDLIERRKLWITEEQLLANASKITLDCDAYQDFFAGCIEFATDSANPLDDCGIVKYCGVPGGEAFRGSYYLRGKALFPSKSSMLDYKFFTKMKYLLDFHPGLVKYADDDFIRAIHEMVKDDLEDVKEFPIGIQIDHMLRVFQTCLMGLKYKNPLYLPFATNHMTRSIYSIPPRYKRGGRLSKACTEILFPELAFVKTQNGVPTIRKTMLRLPLFLPEHISVIKKISSGAVSRLFKWKQANKWYYSHDLNAYMFTALLNAAPYCNWFLSSQAMITGHLYNPDIVNPILTQAKTGSCRYVPILGRMISQELAMRWVYREG
jgi:hypothetical protein